MRGPKNVAERTSRRRGGAGPAHCIWPGPESSSESKWAAGSGRQTPECGAAQSLIFRVARPGWVCQGGVCWLWLLSPAKKSPATK